MRFLAQGHRTSGGAGCHIKSGSDPGLDCCALGLVIPKEAVHCVGEDCGCRRLSRGGDS